jgi:hypothetical protein
MKTVAEWSQAFDLLWNNIFSDKAPGLEEYEKSMFLTLGQEELVKDAFSPKTNVLGEGFDDSIRRQADFVTLVATTSPIAIASNYVTTALNNRGTTRYYMYPDEAFLVLNEEVEVDGKFMTVVPLSYDEYARLMMRPYKYPPKGQVWRLLNTNVMSGSEPYAFQMIELIGNFKNSDVLDYRMRYVQRPHPIILETLGSGSGLSIEGQTEAATCTLPEHLHDEILARAVNLAKIAWVDAAAPQGQLKQ